MAIISYQYYTETYLGEPIAEADFPRAAARAERLIQQITRGRASNIGALPPAIQQAVKEATCAQIEYYALYGTDVSIAGRTSDGWTVGKVRVDGGSSGSVKTGAPSMVCPAAIAALEQTGLLNPQVDTIGEPAKVFWGVI